MAGRSTSRERIAFDKYFERKELETPKQGLYLKLTELSWY